MVSMQVLLCNVDQWYWSIQLLLRVCFLKNLFIRNIHSTALLRYFIKQGCTLYFRIVWRNGKISVPHWWTHLALQLISMCHSQCFRNGGISPIFLWMQRKIGTVADLRAGENSQVLCPPPPLLLLLPDVLPTSLSEPFHREAKPYMALQCA